MSMMAMQMRLDVQHHIHEIAEKAVDRLHEARQKEARRAQLNTLIVTIFTGYFGQKKTKEEKE